MTFRTSLIIAALSVSVFAGCSKHPAAVTFISSSSIAIQPGISIGPVHSGMKQQDVVAVLGEPNSRKDGVLEYHNLGIALLPGKGGFLKTVIFFNGGQPFKPFGGHTTEGVGIGSSRAEIIKAYGEPAKIESARGFPGRSTLVYKTQGINFHIQDDKVYKMAVFLKP